MTVKNALVAGIVALASLTATADANAAYLRCAATWTDYFDVQNRTFLEGGVRAAGVGGKGLVDHSARDLHFDLYDNGTYLGTAEADDSGVTWTGPFQSLTPMAVGSDCNNPNTFVFTYIMANAHGYRFPVFAY